MPVIALNRTIETLFFDRSVRFLGCASLRRRRIGSVKPVKDAYRQISDADSRRADWKWIPCVERCRRLDATRFNWRIMSRGRLIAEFLSSSLSRAS